GATPGSTVSLPPFLLTMQSQPFETHPIVAHHVASMLGELKQQFVERFLDTDFSDIQSTATGVQRLKELVKSIPNSPGRPSDEVLTIQERRLTEPWAEIDEEYARTADECQTSARYGKVHFRAHFNQKESKIVLDSPMLGILLLRPNDETYTEGLLDPPTVWIRPSQRKIRGQKANANQRRLEVVRTTYLRTPHRINADLIINLAFNGVPPRVFSDLNQKNMQEKFDALTTWTGDRDMPKLCRYIERQGGVLPIRLSRLPPEPTALKANNRFRERHTDLVGEAREEGDGDDDEEEGLLNYFPNLISGQPATLNETVVRLIQSGFTPQGCPYLAELIRYILRKQLEECVHNIELYVVPEAFKDLLGENE
ncbi:5481_t:CDS:2, partial [Acaulospora colombiana]